MQVQGFTVEPTAITVPPGEVGLVRIEAESGGDLQGMLRWSSNDPDEPSGEVRLEPPSGGIGPDEDFLQGFVWPSRDLSTYTLSSSGVASWSWRTSRSTDRSAVWRFQTSNRASVASTPRKTSRSGW